MALNLAAVGSDWTLAASIMTFAIPVALFVVGATVLYFLYTRPHAVPGHRDLAPAGSGRPAPGAPRAAAAQPPPAAQPPRPGGGGYGRHDGTEGAE